VGVLSPSVLLNVWDEAMAQPSPAKAVALLNAAWPEPAPGGWIAASIGDRDRALLRLREQLFGPRLEATARCPGCGQRLEMSFTVEEITAPAPADTAQPRRLSLDGYELLYRTPTTADLLAVGSAGDPVDLLDLCVEALYSGEPFDCRRLPDAVARAVSDAMAAADPQADVQIEMDCPGCAHRWNATFDILTFLWGEIDDWAAITLREVHALASAYGWSEREVLSLSPRRRRVYLEMVSG
jgi:hypothetical protein